jgi:ATP-dependent protease Clp ATPase subunit
MIDELATLRFVAEKANVLLIGPPGVGKTHCESAFRLSSWASARLAPAVTDLTRKTH